MTKRFWIIFASIALIFATILTSCFIVNSEEDDSLPAPSVLKGTASSTQYSISIPYIKNMEYANILRQKCLDKDFIESETVKITTENIGQVNVNTEKNISNIPSFAFEDYYTAATSPQTYYRYAIRYYDGASYTTTKYSDAAEGIGAKEASISFSKTPATITYERNDYNESYKIKIDEDIELPLPANATTSDFTILSIVISNDKISRPYTIIPGATNTTIKASELEIPDLRSILTDDYLGVPLEVKGLIAINKTSDTSETYFRYYWTSFLTDFNFSVAHIDSSGASDTSDLRFIVPTRLSASNDLDATASKVPERAVLNIQ